MCATQITLYLEFVTDTIKRCTEFNTSAKVQYFIEFDNRHRIWYIF